MNFATVVQHFHYLFRNKNVNSRASKMATTQKSVTYTIMLLQFLLIGAYALILLVTPSLQLFFGDQLVGVIVLLVGLAVLASAVLAYRRSVGTFKIKATPAPANRGGLITDGIYSYIRHPFYTATPTIFIGFALLVHRPWGVAVIPLVVGLLYWKSSYEERLLEAKFPEYGLYKSKTGCFLPAFRKNLQQR